MKNEKLAELEAKAEAILPSEERRKKGPYAVFECFQNIPCNPCYTACKFHAVKPLTTITDTPETYYDNCIGCGACILVCPGLAAFVIDETYSKTESLIKMAYEYSPLPEEGQVVDACNRVGEVVGKATVRKIAKNKNKTVLLSISVPKELTHQVRSISLKPRPELITDDCAGHEGGESIVCRCEDVTAEELAKVIGDGKTSLKQVKLNTRVSMGPCQGKTCISLVMRELSIANKVPVNSLKGPSYRVPIKPIKIGSFLKEKE